MAGVDRLRVAGTLRGAGRSDAMELMRKCR